MHEETKAPELIDNILKIGIEPFITPEPLSPAETSDVHLVVWMAVLSEGTKSPLQLPIA